MDKDDKIMLENWDQYKDLEYYPNRVCKCGCGDKIRVKPHHKYYGIPKFIKGHQSRTNHPNRVEREIRTCAAPGCNITFECKITSRKKYCCKGHSRKGKGNSEEQNEKIRKNHKGGGISKPRETRICGCGCKRTFECKVNSKQRFIQGHGSKGKPSWNRGLTKETDERLVETSKKISKLMKSNMLDPEYKEKHIRATLLANKLKPNKPEKFLIKLFQKLFPNEYKYVGDGQVIIAGKCPDFVNINGQKKIIELYGDYWHGEERTGRTNEEEEQQRIEHFAKFGFQTLVIWEHELREPFLLESKIKGFVNV